MKCLRLPLFSAATTPVNAALTALLLAALLLLGTGFSPTALAASKKQSAKHATKHTSKPSAKGKKGLAQKASYTTSSKGGKNARKLSKKQALRARAEPAPLPSMGTLAGLRNTPDGLGLKASVALVVDPSTQEVLLSKNETAVLPIASITKLMTGLLVSEARLPHDEMITLTQDDVMAEKGVHSRLSVGQSISRGELLHLALMSSENRAAHALGRTYPGGIDKFVQLMNTKAQSLGMLHTRYVDPTGLSNQNRSTAHDLALLVTEASKNEEVSKLSTSPGYQLATVGKRGQPTTLNYVNTNRLTYSPAWDIVLQKTGYIAAAGRCLVMKAKVAGRDLVMVFLDSMTKYTRLGDAERVRAWIESNSAVAQPSLAARSAH